MQMSFMVQELFQLGASMFSLIPLLKELWSLLSVRFYSSLDQNKLFVSESLVPLTQLAKWYKTQCQYECRI